MDEGCEVYWEHCYDRDEELSAIQHFYNALIDDGMEVFASEFQQEPLDNEKTANAIKPEELKDRAIKIGRGVVPKSCAMLTSFIDVQGKALYWGVVAWRDGLGGHLVSYGTYPEQPKPYFTLREIPISIQSITGIEDQAAVIHAGLEALVPKILDPTFESETQAATFPVSLLTIDGNWRQYEGVVRDFCRRSRYGTRIMLSHGRHVGAAHRAMDDSTAKPGERSGPGWRTDTKEMQRHLSHDANFWKSMLAARLRAPVASDQAFTFHEGTHELLIDHLTSEYPQIITNETTGRKVEQWELTMGRDNHWWDVLVGAMAAANYMGIEAVGASVKKVALARKKTPEELAAARERLMRLSGLE
jgi:phage terminase large subunit GpA-like protein